MRDGIQRGKHVQSLSASRGAHELPDDAPDTTEEGCQDKVRRVNEQHRATAGARLVQPRLQFDFF